MTLWRSKTADPTRLFTYIGISDDSDIAFFFDSLQEIRERPNNLWTTEDLNREYDMILQDFESLEELMKLIPEEFL